MYWAQELAAQTDDKEMQAKFSTLAKSLTENEKKIVEEMKAVQGKPVEIGGYYKPSAELLQKVMCPSSTFNAILKAAHA
jgi:isocitrate dehydrogenase